MQSMNRYSPPEGMFVSLIFTHQARIRCFVRKTIEPLIGSIQKDSVVGVINDDDNDDDDDDDYDYKYETLGDLDEDPVNMDRDNYDELTSRETIYERPEHLDDYTKINTHDRELVGGGKGFKLPRFKNGSVLEYTVTSDTIEIRLLIDGEVDENKDKYIYYVLPGDEFRDTGAMQGRYKVTPFNPIKLQNNNYQVEPGQKYIFYIIRHGQATHNLLKSKMQKLGNVLSGVKDTDLTIIGREQAQRSGSKMAELIKNRKVLPPGYIFSSDLKRTRQTGSNFITGLLNNIDISSPEYSYITNVSDKHSMIVLPCAHELAFIKTGYCDGKQGALPTPPENQMTCKAGNQSCNYEGHFDVSWDEYYKFYGNSTRSNLCSSCSRRHCKDTDMINEAIRIIKERTGTNTVRPIRFAEGTKRTDGIKTSQGTWLSNPYNGGKKIKRTMRRYKNKNKKQKSKKSYRHKSLTRKYRNKIHNKAKKSKKSKR